MASAMVAVASTMAFSTVARAGVIGQLPPGTPAAGCVAQGDLFQFTTSQGDNYEVKDEGVLTSWSTNAAANPGQQVTFKLFRQVAPGSFVVLAHDTRSLAPGVVNTFKALIPVKPGDIIGLNSGNAATVPNACEFPAEESDSIFFFNGDAGDGANISTHVDDDQFRVNVSATTVAPPSIRTDRPVDLGSIAGGKSIVLTGFNFVDVSAVTFGGVPAAGFTVDSPTQITAVAPPGKTLDTISLAVTNVAGTAVTPDVFSYEGCLVPKLTGKKLSVAKTKLTAAGCRLGRVKGRRSKRAKVVKQSPAKGKLLPPGSKVGVKLR